jgi:UDP-N-acetylmuramate dehydrogenase
MNYLRHVPLADYTTMRLGGKATWLAVVASVDELAEALRFAEERGLRFFMLGGGSNVVSGGDFDGLVIVDRLKGFTVLKDDANGATIRIAAGESWDDVVKRTVDMGLSGIEKLSSIPGTAGATPVQNVGAYGAEIAEVFVELEAYDMQTKKVVTLSKADCQFGYRSSIFKSTADRRYCITSITLQLSRSMPQPPFYASLQKYLDEHHITKYSPQTIRDAVTAIRKRILPDPTQVPNTGSFFKNPFVAQQVCDDLLREYPAMPHWPADDGRVKLAAGWLIDQAGLKGYRAHGMRVYEENALVFVNDGAHEYSELQKFRDEVVSRVREKFGVTLEQEPEIL